MRIFLIAVTFAIVTVSLYAQTGGQHRASPLACDRLALSPEKARALASELADLGTDAADAVAAAARAATPEERAAALKGVLTDEHGEPINRGLLLKFLSSVRS